MGVVVRQGIVLGVVMLLAASGLAGCAGAAPGGSAGLPTTACDSAARVATTDPNRNSRRLDPVLIACTSVADLEAAGSKYGIALVGPHIMAVALRRCRVGTAPRAGSLCPEILALDASADPGPS